MHLVPAGGSQAAGMSGHHRHSLLAARPIRTAHLRDRLSEAAVFVAPARGPDRPQRRVGPPGYCVAAVLDRGRWPSVRPLAGVVPHPVFLPDGSVLTAPGYHEPTGLCLQLAPGLAVSVPDHPTRAEVELARDRLLDLIADFPFARKEHRSTWLAGLLTLLARAAYPGDAPLFLVDGPRPRGREGTAGGRDRPDRPRRPAPGHPVHGRRGGVPQAGDQPGGGRGPGGAADNITGPFGHPAPDAAPTATTWSDRVLGSSQRFEGPLRLTWLGTGNNCHLRGDLDRRVAHVRLESPEQRPELRTVFRHPHLREHVRANRGRYLSDALTLLRGWYAAGRPTARLPGWGSYEGWSGVVRAALVWAGLPDPADTRDELVAQANPERSAVEAVFDQIARIDPGQRGWLAFEPVNTAAKDGELQGALAEWLPEVTTKALGYKLKRLKRQRMNGGRYLDQHSTGSTGSRWVVRVPHPVPSRPGPSGPGEAGEEGDAGDPSAAVAVNRSA